MTAPATLDDDQIERLSQLLEQRAVPFKGFNLEALDGFLSALVVTPDIVPPGEWQPVVWGGTTPRWDGDDEALSVQALLLGHWNMAAARVRYEGDDLPDYLAPLLWLPEEIEVEQDDELDVGRDWAFGFFRAVELRDDVVVAEAAAVEPPSEEDLVRRFMDEFGAEEILPEPDPETPTPGGA